MSFRLFLISAVIIQGANIVFNSNLIYQEFWFLDIIMHFLGGCIVAGLIGTLLKKEGGKLRPHMFIIWLVGGTAIVGVSWEFFEWTLDHFIFTQGTFMGGLDDTLLDLLMDMAGGLLISTSFLQRRIIKK